MNKELSLFSAGTICHKRIQLGFFPGVEPFLYERTDPIFPVRTDVH